MNRDRIPRRRSTDGLVFYPHGHDPGKPILDDGDTIVSYLSAWQWGQPGSFVERPHPLDVLEHMLTEHALDRDMVATGVRRNPRPDAKPPYNEMVHYHGNFHRYACSFSVRTRDPQLIDRLDRLVDRNQRRKDYLDQPDPTPGYIDDLWDRYHNAKTRAEHAESEASRLRDALRDIYSKANGHDPRTLDVDQLARSIATDAWAAANRVA